MEFWQNIHRVGTLDLDFVLGSNWCIYRVSHKNDLLAHLLVSDLGRGVLRGKNNSKKFGNKKNIGLVIKILRKWTLFVRKMQKIM